MEFKITNRFTGCVVFTAQIEATENTPLSIRLGMAVKKAVEARANLADANLADAYLAGAEDVPDFTMPERWASNLQSL